MQQPPDDEYEQLLQFVYACPVGLVDIEKDGTIRLMNPLAMNLMMSLSTDGMVTNLLKSLRNYAPELRSLVQDFSAKRGTICSNHRIYLGPEDTGSSDAPKVLSCTIVKLKDERYVVTLADVSLQVRQERRLRSRDLVRVTSGRRQRFWCCVSRPRWSYKRCKFHSQPANWIRLKRTQWALG